MIPHKNGGMGLYVMECYVENNDENTYNHKQSYAENTLKNTQSVNTLDKTAKNKYIKSYLSAFYKQQVKII